MAVDNKSFVDRARMHARILESYSAISSLTVKLQGDKDALADIANVAAMLRELGGNLPDFRESFVNIFDELSNRFNQVEARTQNSNIAIVNELKVIKSSLRKHDVRISSVEVGQASIAAVEDESDPQSDDNLSRKVLELDISVRIANCMRENGIIYVGDLVQKSYREILCMPNFGRKSLNDLNLILATMGLTFGMNLDGWYRPHEPDDA